VTESVGLESLASWEQVSVHRNMEYYRAKITTIQNPTIRYFVYFLANTLFGRGDLGAMSGHDICVLHMALHPDTTIRANLGALLIAHFRRQRSAGAGDIRIGGLVTQICLVRRIPIPQVEPVAGPKTMDRSFCISAKNLGKYLANPNYRAFQFTFEPHGPVQQELLPFPQAFSLTGRNT